MEIDPVIFKWKNTKRQNNDDAASDWIVVVVINSISFDVWCDQRYLFNLHSTYDTKWIAAVHTGVRSNRIENPHRFGPNFRWHALVETKISWCQSPLASNRWFYCWFEHFQFVESIASIAEIHRFPRWENWSVAHNKTQKLKKKSRDSEVCFVFKWKWWVLNKFIENRLPLHPFWLLCFFWGANCQNACHPTQYCFWHYGSNIHTAAQ